MALPPPEKLQELKKDLDKLPKKKSFGSFDYVTDELWKYAKQAGIAVLQTGLQHAVTAASGAATVTVSVGAASVTVFPIGAALGPWLAAAAIASKANGIFMLYNLKEDASKQGAANYSCSCGQCAKGLTYVIDKKETKVAILAVSVFTAGLPMIVDRINSVRKSFQSNRPKEQISKQFVTSARGGCICAIAAVMMLCGEWKQEEKPDTKLMIEALAIILADDGWRKLKSKW